MSSPIQCSFVVKVGTSVWTVLNLSDLLHHKIDFLSLSSPSPFTILHLSGGAVTTDQCVVLVFCERPNNVVCHDTITHINQGSLCLTDHLCSNTKH